MLPYRKEPPLDPPLSGGQKALPLRGRLASLSGMETALDPPLSGRFVAVVPLIRGIPPKGGGGFAVVPLRASTSRKGGGGCFCSGEPPCFPIGNENGPPSGCYPLIPPYQGGKKLSPFGVALLSYREWKPPYQGRFVAVVPLIRGIPPKGGGGFVCSGEPPCFPVGNENGPPSGCYPLIPLIRGAKSSPPSGSPCFPIGNGNPP